MSDSTAWKRRLARGGQALGVALLAPLGCVTVNLYFPVAEIKTAAEEIVSEVRPESPIEPAAESGTMPSGSDDPAKPAGEAKEPEETRARPLHGAVRRRPARASIESGRRGSILLASFTASPSATAATEEAVETGEGKTSTPAEKKTIRIDVSTPVIKKIRETLLKRYPRLLAYYQKGAIGEGHDGYLALREIEGLNLKEKRDVQTLLLEENADRKNLYTQIARENQIDESLVKDIGLLFSEEWRKKSRTGWWIEPAKGKWEKKKPEEKKKVKGEKG